jgi:hypothetical protein
MNAFLSCETWGLHSDKHSNGRIPTFRKTMLLPSSGWSEWGLEVDIPVLYVYPCPSLTDFFLKLEAAWPPETLISYYITTRCTQDHDLKLFSCLAQRMLGSRVRIPLYKWMFVHIFCDSRNSAMNQAVVSGAQEGSASFISCKTTSKCLILKTRTWSQWRRNKANSTLHDPTANLSPSLEIPFLLDNAIDRKANH